MDTTVLIELLTASVRIATPLLFAALGGVLSENAGTFAVGLEGMMLMGAFGGAVTPYLIALAVLCEVGRAARMPAAIGKPFTRS